MAEFCPRSPLFFPLPIQRLVNKLVFSRAVPDVKESWFFSFPTWNEDLFCLKLTVEMF